MTTIKGRRYAPEQAVGKLHEGARFLNAPQELGLELCELEITESTWNRSHSIYGM